MAQKRYRVAPIISKLRRVDVERWSEQLSSIPVVNWSVSLLCEIYKQQMEFGKSMNQGSSNGRRYLPITLDHDSISLNFCNLSRGLKLVVWGLGIVLPKVAL